MPISSDARGFCCYVLHIIAINYIVEDRLAKRAILARKIAKLELINAMAELTYRANWEQSQAQTLWKAKTRMRLGISW